MSAAAPAQLTSLSLPPLVHHLYVARELISRRQQQQLQQQGQPGVSGGPTSATPVGCVSPEPQLQQRASMAAAGAAAGLHQQRWLESPRAQPWWATYRRRRRSSSGLLQGSPWQKHLQLQGQRAWAQAAGNLGKTGVPHFRCPFLVVPPAFIFLFGKCPKLLFESQVHPHIQQ